MEDKIVIHKTADEIPPDSVQFIVGREEDGQKFAMPCSYSQNKKRWKVGHRYWSYNELANKWPFWFDVPDFEEVTEVVKKPFTLKGFPEDEQLPDDFTIEDLVKLNYRTDIQRILRSIVIELGTEVDGKQLYSLTDEDTKKGISEMKMTSVFLAIVTDTECWEYKYFYPGKVVIYDYSRYSRDFSLSDLPTSATHKESIKILKLIQNKIIGIKKDSPDIISPKDYDPEYGFGARITRINDLYYSGLLSVRANNCLNFQTDFNYIEDLVGVSVSELKKIRNLGKVSLQEILDVCDKYGITLNP